MKEINIERKQIGNQLRIIREHNGWSVAQVAEMAGIRASTLEKIEAGTINVTFDILTKITSVINCKVEIKQLEQ